MKKLMIYIPTMGRVHRQPSLMRLPPAWQKRTFLVCPPEEVKQHATKTATVLGCPAKGIAATRDWILQHAKRKGFKHIVMLDDDLVLQARRDGGKITNLEGKEFDQAFGWLDVQLKTHAAASFGPRFLSYARPGDEWYGKRMMYVLAYNVAMFHKAKASFTRGLPPMPVMEDFHVTLQLLKAGMPNVLSLLWRVSPYVANAAGGCSLWRNLDIINASARAMEKLHAPFVVLRPKKNWKGLDGEQYDVTVYWQKAAKAGGVL